MPPVGPHLGTQDIVVGVDLGSQEHHAVVEDAQGRRLTSFRVKHSREGFRELVRCAEKHRRDCGVGQVLFAFEATGHFWEALGHFLEANGYAYVLVNPLATFRVREARQMGRDKRDLTDAEQIAHLLRSGVITRTQLEAAKYVELRRAWGEFARLRYERARLRTHIVHQLYGLFPEFVAVWKNLYLPGPLAVLRLGLTPAEIASMPRAEFFQRARAVSQGRRLWRYKVDQVHEYAGKSVASPRGAGLMAAEIQRLVTRIDMLSAQIESCSQAIQALLPSFEEARYLATMPGIGWVTVAGLIAQIGSIDRYKHGRQLVKLAGINPSRRESGMKVGRTMMTRRGRADLRSIVYMATVSSIQHNPRLKAHYNRLVQRPERPLTKMQALGACMTKFLLYAFAVMKRRQCFDADHRWEESNERREVA